MAKASIITARMMTTTINSFSARLSVLKMTCGPLMRLMYLKRRTATVNAPAP